jgi:hypothetical protein
MKCIVCDAVSQLAHDPPSVSDVGDAFILGVAFGFMIRTSTTYVEACPEHHAALKKALLDADAREVPVQQDGTKDS